MEKPPVEDHSARVDAITDFECLAWAQVKRGVLSALEAEEAIDAFISWGETE